MELGEANSLAGAQDRCEELEVFLRGESPEIFRDRWESGLKP
jgi:hypothetical protein